MSTKIIIIAIAIVAVAGLSFMAFQLPQVRSSFQTLQPGGITSFEQCQKAGYPIEESFPEQCRTPQGQVFVADIPTGEQGCQNDLSCGQAKWCDQGVCKAIEYAYDCQQDSDCQLINQDNGFSCCYVGQCDPIDYSQTNWIAVNGVQFSKQSAGHCSTKDQCGVPPACPTSIKPSNYVAVCQQGRCAKTERIAPVPKKNPPLVPNKN